MSSRAQYLLKIGGSLESKLTREEVEKQVTPALAGIFDKPDEKNATGVAGNPNSGGWPLGFLLQDYCRCQWDFRVDQPYPQDRPQEFTLSFRAEIHHVRDGSLFDNREQMLTEVAWFYNYRKYDWWKDLNKKLVDANVNLLMAFKQEKVKKEEVGPFTRIIWFQDWQWYCGNSGS
jgi:hypothetical protein